MPPAALYTAENCSAAYQLHFAVSLFCKTPLPDTSAWLAQVRGPLENDGIRILNEHATNQRTLLFWTSVQPHISPSDIVRLLKGRVQYAVRAQVPQAFRRNYRIESVGSASLDIVQAYVAGQIDHHPAADARIQERLSRFQIDNRDVDLSCLRYSAHGQFLHNLHLVLENADNLADVRHDVLQATQEMIVGVCRKKGYWLSRAGLVANHLHLAIGCDVADAPREVALAFLNNLAYAQGMKAAYRFGFYVGTFGNFDLGALRLAEHAAP